MSKKSPVLGYVLYVFSLALFAYSIWATYESIIFITDQMDQGLVWQENVFVIANYIVSNVVPYLVYAMVVFTLGWIISPITGRKILVDDSGDLEDGMLPDEGQSSEDQSSDDGSQIPEGEGESE